MQSRNLLASPPPTLPKLEDCTFYHSIDLPGLGLQAGSWDLRGHYDEYFGGNDFAGKRVLDLGMASGALAFEMERRGAREVVGFDLDVGLTYDCRLPVDDATLEEFRRGVQRVKNGFWLAHGLLQSQVRVVYGHASSLPDDLGWFDTIMMGNILQHLQDPVGAILQAVQHADHLIITEADWLEGIGDDQPYMIMYDLPHPFSWYQVKPGLLQTLLRRWGFTDQTLTWHRQMMLRGPLYSEDGKVSWEESAVSAKHYTLSMRRNRTRIPMNELPLPPLEFRRLVGPTEPEFFDNPTRRPVFENIPEEAYSTVFDFGCGCGRLARQLIQQHPRPLRYLGVDRHKGMVEWARAHLKPHAQGFDFYHHDVFHEHLNPQGTPGHLPFPAGDNEVTLFIAWSVFTHLLEPDADFYLRELSRVLSPGGVAVTTWFLFDKGDFPMMQAFQNALMINPDDPTNAVIFDRGWLAQRLTELELVMTSITPPSIRGFQWTIQIEHGTGNGSVEFPEDHAPRGLARPPVL